jgi:hypothetical protein
LRIRAQENTLGMRYRFPINRLPACSQETAMTTSDHLLHFEPTVDELAALKKLEMGESISLESAAREHISKRLLEFGLAHQDTAKKWSITALGRDLIRRQED